MIHQYKNNGYNIVLDVNSGSVHVVDELVYDAIAYMVDNQLEKAEQSVAYEALKEHFSDGDLSEIVEEIYELKEQGMLFTEDIYEKSIDAFKTVRLLSRRSACILHMTAISNASTVLRRRANIMADVR